MSTEPGKNEEKIDVTDLKIGDRLKKTIELIFAEVKDGIPRVDAIVFNVRNFIGKKETIIKVVIEPTTDERKFDLIKINKRLGKLGLQVITVYHYHEPKNFSIILNYQDDYRLEVKCPPVGMIFELASIY